ncbi:MAG: UDP-N-acetylmuramate dehydrogenase [Pseudomonadota bacterium]|uniref:UDP-N-acetylmuramate dehydrogenase n=1 Tax=Gallaecimonas pentaromativorans TaxID=584787 RepID=UPI00067F110F|nr:UDP-N-acetylmuramate dehydrogenase [Gallaecimonas pentaromativorans]MED5526731.1 UDP-N-acetylmuramate dehydrogenase [Pseudomonadota bacterium]
MHILSNTPLQPFNTFGLAANSSGFCLLEDINTLRETLPLAASANVLALGGGSNVLFCEDYEGLILKNALQGRTVRESDDAYHLHVMGGESWPELVDWTVAQGLGGLENLALIPGTAGAAPIQNIGAYGVELAERCEYVEFIDFDGGGLHRLSREECRFGYRDSIFKGELQGKVFITALGLRLEKQWQPVLDYAPLSELAYDGAEPHQISELVKSVRRAKLPDPSLLGNAGSFYKNPTITRTAFDALKEGYPDLPGFIQADEQVKVPAAWLIDKAGWKGKRLGGAGVHQHQALVLVNYGQATANDVLTLGRQIRDDVEAKFGIRLVPEIRLIGASGEFSL